MLSSDIPKDFLYSNSSIPNSFQTFEIDLTSTKLFLQSKKFILAGLR